MLLARSNCNITTNTSPSVHRATARAARRGRGLELELPWCVGRAEASLLRERVSGARPQLGYLLPLVHLLDMLF